MRRKRPKRELAAARFFLRVGQAGEANYRCPYTMPLFPLTLILDADGTLAQDARHLVAEGKGKR